MTLKDTIYNILLNIPETRDSDKKLIWEVWKQLNLIDNVNLFYDSITYGNFISAPSNESVRRCRQALQRSDLLTGTKLIQPTTKVKEHRIKLSKEKGASFMMGKDPVKEEWLFNPETGEYGNGM